MPAKHVKWPGIKGASIIKSFRLPNGNLVIPARMGHDRELCEWIEVAPGTPQHKRWLPVAVDEPDPREHSDEQKRIADIRATQAYQEWSSHKSG